MGQRRHPLSLGAIGRALLVLAGLIVAFVAYQLWGTGIVQSREQHALRAQFDRSIAATRRPAPGPGGGAAVAPVTAAPAPGRPVATLAIPRIGLDQVVVEGVGADQLALGPGHYPGTALPGQPGNAAIAGHRTTHGRPFYDLNELASGDRITTTTEQGTFDYRVTSSELVAPTDVSVLAPSAVPELTLTTCNPRYSAAQRLVVVAVLTSRVAPGVSPAARGALAMEAGPDPVRQAAAWIRLAAWALVCGALVLATRWVRRRRRRVGDRAWPALLIAGPAAVVVLFFFFGAVNTLLPPSF